MVFYFRVQLGFPLSKLVDLYVLLVQIEIQLLNLGCYCCVMLTSSLVDLAQLNVSLP